MLSPNVRLALVLGLLILGGPFATDMYLPSLPEIADDLGVGPAAVQYTLMAYFVPFGAAQMIYGPLADQYGRKLPIYLGLSLFFVGAVGAVFAATLEQLLVWRALQGAGGAATMVISRAIVRDLETGPAATRLMATIMLVIAVSPMVAPLAGSGVSALAGWRAVFGFIAGMVVLSLLLARFAISETLPVERRVPINIANMRRGFGRLLRHGGFVGLTLTGALGISSFFIFISSAPFVYSGVYGFSPTGFALAFALNGLGFFTASQFAGPLGARIGMARMVMIGMGVFVFFALLLASLAVLGPVPAWGVIGLLVVANSGLGLVIPSVMVMALEDHGEIAGLASSLGGTIQMTTAGLAIAVISPFFDGTLLPMVVSIATCAVLGFTIAIVTLGRRKTATA